VSKYANDCALYCLVIDQSVADINKCFQDGGVSPQVILCNGNNTASATGRPTATSTDPSATGNPSATNKDGTATNPASSTVAPAPGSVGTQSVSKASLGMLGLLFVSAAVGAML